jgi:phosphate butyryltransferase
MARAADIRGRMMALSDFGQLRAQVRAAGDRSLSVAGGNDPEVIAAVVSALREGLVARAILTGDVAAMTARLPDELADRIALQPAADAVACARLAVAAVRAGEADVLMKGQVDSTAFLRAVVDRQSGIRRSAVLSNVTVAAMPSYPKFLAATDNGIVPAPDLDQKRQIILNTAPLYRGLGIASVKVAALAATEKVSEAVPATVDAAQLARESREGRLPGFVVDGPFAYDVAVSRQAAQAKRLDGSPVAGDADLLLFPGIDSANAVAKAWKFHGAAETGSVVLGAAVPVLLNSRSDGAARRINALLLALIMPRET